VSDRTYVINEIVGTSTVDVNTAIRNGIKRANETLRHLDWFELVEVRGAIMDGEVNYYQVTLKVGFRLEDKDE
jgi:flavin-binding protein dodecin